MMHVLEQNDEFNCIQLTTAATEESTWNVHLHKEWLYSNVVMTEQRLKEVEVEGSNYVCHNPHCTYFLILGFYFGVVFWAESCLWMLTDIYVYICFVKEKKTVSGYDCYKTQIALTDYCL